MKKLIPLQFMNLLLVYFLTDVHVLMFNAVSCISYSVAPSVTKRSIAITMESSMLGKINHISVLL